MNDIEILEKMVEEYNASYPEEKEWIAIYPNQMQALENLLKERQADKDRIKELEHSNKYNVVSKYTIRKKIEELNKEEQKELKGMKGQDRYAVKQEYQFKRNILQELLGEKQDLQINKEE